MAETLYALRNAAEIPSPSLVYYEERVRDNTSEAIRTAGGPERLWPHVKTHKMPAVVRMQMEMGIVRFKCATIAEAEMTAACGAAEIILAYPLVGPAMDRFLRLPGLFPKTRFWAVGDDIDQLAELGEKAQAHGFSQPALADVDLGMHRTGVPVSRLDAFYRRAAALPGLTLGGLHCYDGHVNQSDPAARRAEAQQCAAPAYAVRDALAADGLDCGIMVMGGSLSFFAHSLTPGVFLSPGTIFINDYGYSLKLTELQVTPAAAILSRVVSLPGDRLFTIDTGSKAIAADPEGVRGSIANLPEAQPLRQSEEHWVFRLPEGADSRFPRIGDIMYVIPTHICPTTSLYPSALVARDGLVVDRWEVTARNRMLTV